MVIFRYHSFQFGHQINRILPVSVPDLPKPTRTLNLSVRPEFWNPMLLIQIIETRKLKDWFHLSIHECVLTRFEGRMKATNLPDLLKPTVTLDSALKNLILWTNTDAEHSILAKFAFRFNMNVSGSQIQV